MSVAQPGRQPIRPRQQKHAAAEDERRAVADTAANVDGTFAVLEGARGYGGNDFKIPLTQRTLHSVLAETTRT